MRNQLNDLKRKILIVEDNEINREILSELLCEEYELICAENGSEGIELLKKHREQLSLVLLDVYMPICDGFEFLRITQRDPYLSSIPVIVTTGSNKHEDEETCLRLGATDFITKPYQPEVLMQRISYIIRYREFLTTLSVVEYDTVTGLYTMSAFFHHAGQILAERDDEFDMVVVNVRDYSALNNAYGERKSLEVLKYIGQSLRADLVNVLIARQDNYFYILTPSKLRKSAEEILENGKRLSNNGPVSNLRIYTSLYLNVDKSQPVSVLCNKAKMSLRSAISNGMITVGYYDEQLEEDLRFEQILVLSFDQALENHEFVIYIQPKVNAETGNVECGEALVRWLGPDGNMISPGIFIPLLEKEDLIWKLDEYVFKMVCSYQQTSSIVPISINLSRNSLCRSDVITRYKEIAKSYSVDLKMIPIEITESAVIGDHHIIEICNEFTEAGFVLHMDDFGSGYSSLSSLTVLPFEVLKIDKSLIDKVETKKGNIIVRSMIEMAKALGMKTVAEGVETKEQADILLKGECDLIQGYYYSKPVSLQEFTSFIEVKNFFDEKKLTSRYSEKIIRISSLELRKYLRACKLLFPIVRILEPEHNQYWLVDETGSIAAQTKRCFEVWNRKEPCTNCISKRALQTKKTEHKFEVFDNVVYIVYAAFVEVDGKPRVIELLNVVGDDMLNGYQNNPNFLDAIRKFNVDIYMDGQLDVFNRSFYEDNFNRLDNVTVAVLFRIDNFKKINDTYGFKVGNNVLKNVCQVIKQNIRKQDYFIRMSGDSCLLVFDSMDEKYVQKKMEIIQSLVSNLKFDELLDQTITISIGGSCCQGLSKEVIDAIDAAMTKEKENKKVIVL